jgi:nucleotide-binding universal stress UspA family protein
MKLLIAYDGSKHAQAAILDLPRSGLPGLASALIITVGDLAAAVIGTPSLDPSIARRPGALVAQTDVETAASLSNAEQLAREGAALVTSTFAGWEVTTHVRLGKPAEVILDSADAFGADLIVVGAQGRSAVGRLLLGSVSQYVANKSDRSVMVARHVVDRGANPVRLIVSIDGSTASHGTVEAVASRSWGENTEVHLVAVAHTYRATSVARRIATAAAWIDESNQSRRDTARAALEHALRVLAAARLRTTAHFAEGAGQRVLIEHAVEFDADCIFVGGRSFSGGVPTGTADTINALVTSAPCTVEIVR